MTTARYTYCTRCLSCVLLTYTHHRHDDAADNAWLECADCRNIQPAANFVHHAPVSALFASAGTDRRSWYMRQLGLASVHYRAPGIAQQLADVLALTGYRRK